MLQGQDFSTRGFGWPMAQTGLVLQGGGALGAYELGALKRLHEEASFQPDVISGVSIGAITAATLVGARGDPIETLEALWRRFTMPSSPLLPQVSQRFLALFGDAAFFRMRTDYLEGAVCTSFYDTSPLRDTLLDFVDFDKIARSPVKLLVTATNVATGGVEVLDNRVITVDHILASGALPPGFPMVEIKRNVYWDGGVFDNSPLGPVIENLDPDPNVPKEIIVIDLFPASGPIPNNMLDVFDRAFEITFSNKFKSDVHQANRVNDLVEALRAIDKALPAGDPARRLPGYKRLTQYTFIDDIIYIENVHPEVVFGPFDFSKKSIESRVRAGYRDTETAIKARPAKALRPGLLRAPT
jgi:predicted acylesterase/phospholipase RssA